MTIPEKFKHRLTISPNEAAEIMGVHRSTGYRHIMPFVLSGDIASLCIGRRRCIYLASFIAWLEAQSSDNTREEAA
jgi:excisionase family DNA binding protein